MKPVPSMPSRGFSSSAWQALERAAVRHRSAATVFRSLSRLVQPVGPASAAGEAWPCDAAQAPSVAAGAAGAAAVAATAMPSHTLDAPFDQWAALTDAYAEQFLRMQRGDKTARDKAIRLSNQMLRMNEAMKCPA